MKKMKALSALALALVLLVCWVPGYAEHESNQPFHYLTQDAFLEWFRGYVPEAEIEWSEWEYWASYQEGSAAVTAILSEDQSCVRSVEMAINSMTGITEQQINTISLICAEVGDTVSEESLQAVRDYFAQEHSWEEFLEQSSVDLCASDGGKAAVRLFDWGFSLEIVFSEETAVSFTPEDFYNMIAKQGGTILYMNCDRNGETPSGNYRASLNLNYDGALESVYMEYQGGDIGEGKAFLLDVAALLTGGETLEAIRTAINDNIEKSSTEGIRVRENYDDISFSLNGDSSSVSLNIYTNMSHYPSDAIGFIDGRIFEKLPNLQ